MAFGGIQVKLNHYFNSVAAYINKRFHGMVFYIQYFNLMKWMDVFSQYFLGLFRGLIISLGDHEYWISGFLDSSIPDIPLNFSYQFILKTLVRDGDKLKK